MADGSHEIAAIPDLLRVLHLAGAVVILDAAGCQKAIADQVWGQGGDYLLAVKGNQPALRDAVVAAFDRAAAAEYAGCDQHEAVGDGHGRHEEQYVTVLSDPEGLPPGWPDVAAVVLVGPEREVGGVNASSAHYYVTSRREPNTGSTGVMRPASGQTTSMQHMRPLLHKNLSAANKVNFS